MCFPSGQSLATTQAEIIQEFPSDTTILWQGKQTSGQPDKCRQREFERCSWVLDHGAGLIQSCNTFLFISSLCMAAYSRSAVAAIAGLAVTKSVHTLAKFARSRVTYGFEKTPDRKCS